MSAACPQWAPEVAAYVLGALEPADRRRVEAHLARCESCREALATLASLPGLMSRLSLPEAAGGPPAANEEMLTRLMRAAATERRTARTRWWVAAAAVLLVLGGAVGGVAGYRAATAPRWDTVAATHGQVQMTVHLHPTSTGTDLRLQLSGVPAGTRCQLVALSDDAEREVAGWWTASYQGTASISGTTSISYGHLARLTVETASGTVLVASGVPDR